MKIKVFRVYTGPTLVNTVASAFLASHLGSVVRGTEWVYVSACHWQEVQNALDDHFSRAAGFRVQFVRDGELQTL